MSVTNVYATLEETKDQIDKTSATDDEHLLSLLSVSSRLIDSITNRKFYPELKTIYLNMAQGKDMVWLRDNILEVTDLQISDDNGETYTSLASSEYFLTNGIDFEEPHQAILLNPNGDQGWFYPGIRAVKVTGIFGYHDNYSNAWLDTGDTVQDNPMTDSQSSLLVSDIDGLDSLSLYSRFSLGDLLKIESEYLGLTSIDTGTNTATVLRNQNGSVAAEHVQNTTIYKWSVHPTVKQACVMQTIRLWKRAESAFQDSTANAQNAQLRFTKQIDPEVKMMLDRSRLIKFSVG